MDDSQTTQPEKHDTGSEAKEQAHEDQSGMKMNESNVEHIMSLENMINGYLMDLKKLQAQLKEQSAMLKDMFENDAEYTTVLEKVKEAARKKKEVRDRILKDPATAALEAKVNDIRSEVKETQTAISDYLMQYYQESGMRQITGSDGEIREIVTTVKLVKRRGKSS